MLTLKYNIKKILEILCVLNSPFKPFKLRFYFGKIAYGTPYFFPRRWVKSKNKSGYLTTIPKKIGFDFVYLGWKTKWSIEDIRFEHGPLISFVFFKYQFCIFFNVPQMDSYWAAWLYYYYYTDRKKSKEERLKHCIEEFNITWIVFSKEKEGKKVNYYNEILRKKYLKLIT